MQSQTTVRPNMVPSTLHTYISFLALFLLGRPIHGKWHVSSYLSPCTSVVLTHIVLSGNESACLEEWGRGIKVRKDDHGNDSKCKVTTWSDSACAGVSSPVDHFDTCFDVDFASIQVAC